ncbi:Esterase/lipase/thioesterase [Tulasnella sp. 419]|nr:Esterase/lipase/thioesterase [Tulasnella sp. 419]
MQSLIPLLSSLLLFTVVVTGHGFVESVKVGGSDYSGFMPFTDPWLDPVPVRVIRPIPDDGPVTLEDATTNKIICGNLVPTSAGIHAPIEPGEEVTFKWSRWPFEHKGPIVTSMARCGDNSCDGYDATGAVWMKIHQRGFINPDGLGNWWGTDELRANDLRWTVKIPDDLVPGAYLLRTEITAMHMPQAPQFYPSCTQLLVRGNGKAFARQQDLFAMTEIYKNADASINPNIWSPLPGYTIAGPDVATFVTEGAADPEDLPTNESTMPALTATPAATGTSRGPTQTDQAVIAKKRAKACRPKKKTGLTPGVSKRHITHEKRWSWLGL